MKTIMRKALAVAVIAGVSGGVMAAQDGTLGGLPGGGAVSGSPAGSSQGNFDITFTKGAQTRIWGLDDFEFDNVLTAADVSACVYSNSDSGNYSITATSTNSWALVGGAGSGANIGYTVTFDDGTTTTTNGTSGNFAAGAIATQPDPSSTSCGTSNLKISVALDTAITDINRVQQGTYTDTVTVTVSPR